MTLLVTHTTNVASIKKNTTTGEIETIIKDLKSKR